MTRPPDEVRYGLADMGSHAIRFQIVQREADGHCRILDQRREPVRLGGDLFGTHAIPEPAIAEAAARFASFRAACDRHGVSRIHAIATAAARQAANGDRLLARIEQAAGIRVEVISGEREARLLLRAVAGRIDLGTGTTLVADVGGGSVELILVDRGEVAAMASHPCGALWLLSRGKPAGRDDPATYRREMEPLARAAAALLQGRVVDRYAITGGGSASLAALLLDRGIGHAIDGVTSLPLPAVAAELERLAGMPLTERRQLPWVPADRADTIVAGGVIYLRLGKLAGAETVLVPGVGLRDGLLLEVCGARTPPTGSRPVPGPLTTRPGGRLA